jgi:hypothetical protein
MMNVLRSELDPRFYRERVRFCLELAEMSEAVPSIKSRLEGLAREYQQRIDDLEGISQVSPPLAPDQDCDGSVQSTSGTVGATAAAVNHSD